ncbi:TPA: hypothetical protein N0F65_010541, partial [Lagenidium giganteum]
RLEAERRPRRLHWQSLHVSPARPPASASASAPDSPFVPSTMRPATFYMRVGALAAMLLVAAYAGNGRSNGMENALRGGAWTFHADNEQEPCPNDRKDCQFATSPHAGVFESTDMEAANATTKATLKVSRKVIRHLDPLSVTFDLRKGAPTSKDWIGVFCVDDPNVPIPDEQYMDWQWTNGKASGTVDFGKMTNMRCLWQFRFFTQVDGKYVKIADSDPVRFVHGKEEPLQVHVAATEDLTEMRVMWTSAEVSNPVVWYGPDPDFLVFMAEGSGTTYKASDMCHAPATQVAAQRYRDPGIMYNAVMSGLVPGETYYYRVGDLDGVTSEVFKARMPPAPGLQDDVASFFVYGDLGDWNIKPSGPAPPGRTGTTIDLIRQDMDEPGANYVAIMHDGDISYALGRTYLWDQFGAMIQPIATEIPYMVGIGNHEYCHTSGGDKDPSGAPGNGFHPPDGNFGVDSGGECGVPFNKRFIMPNNGNQVFWWSVEMGLVHHTVISSEHDFTPGSPMFKWLERDLRRVDRDITPWIFLHLHRPMYCSEDYASDYRVSLMIRKNLEPLLGKYRVDAVFSGHYHAFERTCPVYKEECRSIKLDNGLEQAQAPVHFMVGSGGADVDNTGYYNVTWRAAAMMEYGYGRVHVHNATHAQLEFKRNRDKSIADSSWLISDHDWSWMPGTAMASTDMASSSPLGAVDDNWCAAAGTLLLPEVKIKASANSKQVEKRLKYLWSAAHAMLPANAAMAHQLMLRFMAFVKESRVELPADVLDYICARCAALLVPGVSAAVRVVAQADNARLKRKIKQKRKQRSVDNAKPAPEALRNALRVTCSRCQHGNVYAAASVVHKPRAGKRVRAAAAADAPEPKRSKTGDQATGASSAATPSAAAPAAASAKTTAVPSKLSPAAKAAPVAPVVQSMFAPPPSPPRKLLDGPKRKKKKKPDAAQAAVKSSLNSFLSSLRPGNK